MDFMGELMTALASVLVLGATLLLGGWSGTETRSRPTDGGCERACYETKSKAYQACRRIPPTDREARERCFREADAALQRCLRNCR